MVSFHVHNKLKSVNFVGIILFYHNKCIYKNFRIKVIFHYVSAWASEMGCGCLPLSELAVHRISHARLSDLLIKVKTLLCQCELQEYQLLYFICVYHTDLLDEFFLALN